MFIDERYAKKMSKDDFIKLCESEEVKRKPRAKYITTLKDGYKVICESKQECAVIRKLNKIDDIDVIRTQCIAIPYIYGVKNKMYYPDIAVHYSCGYIQILEVKELIDMPQRQNRKKFSYLRVYCRRKGYSYAVVDKHLNSYFAKWGSNRNKNAVTKYIEKCIEDKGYFDINDYKN